MALNETTGIDYDVHRFAVWQESGSRFIDFHAKWIRVDGGPVDGGINGLKYYKRVESPQPPKDHRYTIQTTWTAVDADPEAPEGWPAGEYVQTHQVQKLSNEVLKLQVESAFQTEVRKQFPDTENPSTLLLAAKALAKKQTGVVLTDEETATLAAVTSTGDRVTQLMSAKLAFDAAIDADEDYDLTQWPQV